MIPNSVSNFTVVINEYDPTWPSLYENEVQQLQNALPLLFLELHHIGSTSVPGLAAKPIIDILGIVDEISLIDSKQKILESIGFFLIGKFEITGRRYYFKNDPTKNYDLVHLHVIEKGNGAIKRNLFFRDYLRENALAAQAYGSLKRNLAAQYPDYRDKYQDEKGPFIRFILAQDREEPFKFQNGKDEYGIKFICDCFPKGRFNKEFAGKRTGFDAQTSFKKPIYSKILFTMTQVCSQLLKTIINLFHFLDGHKKTTKLLSGLENE